MALSIGWKGGSLPVIAAVNDLDPDEVYARFNVGRYVSIASSGGVSVSYGWVAMV